MSRIKLGFGILILLAACTGQGGGGQSEGGQKVKLEQYLVEGQQLYLQYCSACHQREGQGLAQLYPPLSNADYLDDNVEGVVCIVKNGLQGPIVVNGVEYNQAMPANPTLTPLEIAEIVTYVYNSWGREHGLVPVTEVEKILKTCNAGD